MEALLATALSLFVPEKCVKVYLTNGDIYNVECFKILLSKLLGYGIIAGSTLVKIPQLIKILRSGSTRGLSITSSLLELLCCTTSAAYSFYMKFAFSSYGDSVFVGLQTLIITLLIISWQKSNLLGILFLSSYVASIAYLLSPLVSFSLLASLQAMIVPIIFLSRGLQIFTNWRNGSTGQLSAISVWLMTAGSLARIFTSIQETGDNLVILTFVASSSVNVILSLQLIYYWNCLLPSDTGRKQKRQ